MDFNIAPQTPCEITLLTKEDGPLTKRISLTADGKIKSDGSACIMVRGVAQRVSVSDVHALAAVIGSAGPNQALALGSLRSDLPDKVAVVTKGKLGSINGADVIARTADAITYRHRQPTPVLLDHDSKGMPASVRDELARLGGFRAALLVVCPDLEDAAHVLRRSTSAGLSRSDTGEQMPGSDGLHDYVMTQDGADIIRFLKTLHARCWLHGLGWMMIGSSGQLLERSIVDRMVGGAERLVFEGGPILEPPLVQDAESRRPVAFEGDLLDTLAACPPLTIVEKAQLGELQKKERHRLAPEAALVQEAFVAQRAKRLSERTGLSEPEARKTIERQCAGILHPDVELPFDDPEFAGRTVRDVLADPERFVGATLADPIEGPEYGHCCAKVMRRADGSLWIHSFAHGRTTYELKLDAREVMAALEKARDPDKAFIELALSADLDDAETEFLRNQVSKRSGTGKRTLTGMLKSARKEQTKRIEQELRDWQATQRNDPRPPIPAPELDAPWLPVMATINEVLSRSARPPWRDMDGDLTQVRLLRIPDMHAFTTAEVNANDLPPPEQWLLSKQNEMEAAETIERHIDYIGQFGSVHLGMPFVSHYMNRDDGALNTLVAISLVPLVLPSGELLNLDGYGFDAERGILFKIPRQLRVIVPRREDCTEKRVREAMTFLTDEWLCDVATDYIGKATTIATALTIMERSLLPDRPTFWVTAGRRGGGKTTLLTMLIMAVTGLRPAAASWSPNEEERRKALLSYFIAGAPYILWDNLNRGATIGCPHIERSCTSAFYADRKLGVSETVVAAASTVHLFTGNNIAPRGDLASRSLGIRLDVDRPDPENREFKHPDPVGWTSSHRADILSALYTILLGNPALGDTSDAAAQTRFKMWWRLVGSAVEHATALANPNVNLNFRDLFLLQEESDDESSSLSEVLEAMVARWPGGFTAVEVTAVMNDLLGDDFGTTLREFFYPGPAPIRVSPKSVGRLLKRHVDAPVWSGERVLILRVLPQKDHQTGGLAYHVEVKPAAKA